MTEEGARYRIIAQTKRCCMTRSTPPLGARDEELGSPIRYEIGYLGKPGGVACAGFFGLLCVLAVGFMSELRASASNSGEYGYDEQLGAQTPSLSGAKLVANCSDKGAAIVGAAAMDSLDELRAGAITARGGPTSAAKLHNQAIGGHLVE